MNWKKALKQLPVDNEEVIIKSSTGFYIAIYNSSAKEFTDKKCGNKIPLKQVELWASLESTEHSKKEN